ncbi:MAG: LuxR family transcriptional regulator [Hoeflea sp.]|uniref:helix-turn-helix transcriptional regulator n=1 Tax=Hoeflea sp. TaxID=1940281 RepID=UPI00272F0894|nr:LuxR family transcriptional regulator [Hoeflea sp.]MDP2120068.1 LuxR family transcriptional regulator [Hoeflea sp.]MDZ7601881.1 LuxR family transcriptional regulator [Hoeflea sp.]
MSTRDAAVFEFIERVDGHDSVEDLLDDLLQVVGNFGFQHMIYTGLPAGDGSIAPLVKTNRFPEDWWNLYVEGDYAKTDAVCQQVFAKVEPFVWNEVDPRLTAREGAARIAGEAAEHGLADGYVVPLFSRDEWLSVMSFGGPDKLMLSPRDRGAINLMAIYTSSTIERRQRRQTERGRLTGREREVLLWTSAGKSCWEISVILNVSEQTVRFHTAQIRAKLNASNTTHAVVRALQQGEITLGQLADRLGDIT